MKKLKVVGLYLTPRELESLAAFLLPDMVPAERRAKLMGGLDGVREKVRSLLPAGTD